MERQNTIRSGWDQSQNPDLQKYRLKRDFTKTNEPAGSHGTAENVFVIQKHAARKLHYDLRLQIAGTLKSWAVPKGLSFTAGQKRLAVRTEDHPIEYKNFEGQIPKGQYGAGEVVIWDRGTFENVTQDSKKHHIRAAQAIENGKLEIIFNGQKLKGQIHSHQAQKHRKR